MPVTDLYGDGGSGLPPGWVIGPDGTPVPSTAGAYPAMGMAPDSAPGTPDVMGNGTAVYSQPGQGIYGPAGPSMGYPGLRNPYAAPVPPTQPSPGSTPTQFATTAGLTLNSNPLAKIGAAAQGAYGNIHDWLAAHWRGGPSMNSPAAASTATPSGPAAPPGYGGIGSDARFPLTGGANVPSSQSGGAYSNMPYPGMVDPSGVYAPTGGVRRGGATNVAPGAGAPAGSPSQTPRPAKTSSKTPNLGYYQPPPKFGTVQYQTTNQRNPPIYTALNLFGGR